MVGRLMESNQVGFHRTEEQLLQRTAAAHGWEAEPLEHPFWVSKEKWIPQGERTHSDWTLVPGERWPRLLECYQDLNFVVQNDSWITLTCCPENLLRQSSGNERFWFSLKKFYFNWQIVIVHILGLEVRYLIHRYMYKDWGHWHIYHRH